MHGPSTSSGNKTASAVILAMSGMLHNFELNPPASGTATLIIYDHPSAASGTVLASVTAVAGAPSVVQNFATPRAASNGIYAALTGTTSYIVGYSPG